MAPPLCRNPIWWRTYRKAGVVGRIELFWRWLRARLGKHRVELALTLRMTVAAVAGLGVAQALALPLPRLRHDVVTIGRIARSEPLPKPMLARLMPRLAGIGRAGAHYLEASGIALATRRAPPSEAALEEAFVEALAEMTAIRGEGATRRLSDTEAGRFFTLSLALEEMRRTFRDLAHDVTVTALSPEND
jgi:hypothetical protein